MGETKERISLHILIGECCLFHTIDTIKLSHSLLNRAHRFGESVPLFHVASFHLRRKKKRKFREDLLRSLQNFLRIDIGFSSISPTQQPVSHMSSLPPRPPFP